VYLEPAVSLPQELLGGVPFHYRDASPPQVAQIMDVGRAFLNHNATVKQHVGEGKVKGRFPLCCSAHQGQGIDFALLQQPPDFRPMPIAKCHIAIHRLERRLQQLDRESVRTPTLFDDTKRRVIVFAA